MIELFACAMLPNGPACSSTGWPSSVCTRFGFDRVPHHHRHRAGDPELLGRHRLAVVRSIGHDDPAEPRAQILQVGRQREDGHDLGRRRDHELVLARDAVRLPAQPDDGTRSSRSFTSSVRGHVIDWRVDVQRVAVVDRRVERRGEQVVRGGDRVEVAVEVEVDLLHRHDLRVAAAGAAALDAEHRPHRRLAEAQHDVRAERAEALRRARSRSWSCPRRPSSG